jgi:serine/threonine-protein kinase
MNLLSTLGVSLGPGAVLAGKYRVERVLGQGGMGVVVAATQLDLGRLVALKFLLDDSAERAEVVARFLREARIVGALRSEHVAKVYELGQLENGAPYMAMEYLEGADLSRTLRERGPLHFAEASSFVRQACEAIAEAHASGVVHRDLKPANLFLTARPNGGALIKVLDFGISKSLALTAAEQSMTKTTTMMGSPHYMSPEQMVRPKAVDLRTDIWSLGVILHELVTDDVPFHGETLAALTLNVHHEEAPVIANVNPHVPAAYQAIVTRCLQKDRERRFVSAVELSHALAECEGSRSHSFPALEPGFVPPARGSREPELEPTVALGAVHGISSPDPAKTAGTWSETIGAKGRSRRRLALILSASAVLGVAAIGAFIELRSPAPVSAERVPGPRSARSVVSASPAAQMPPAPAQPTRSEAPVTAETSAAPRPVASVRAAPARRSSSLTATIPRPTPSSAAAPPKSPAPRAVRSPGWDDELLKP